MKILILIPFLFIVNLAVSQVSTVPALEREISIKTESGLPADVLNEVAVQADIVFSYSPAILKNIDKINLNAKGKSVRYVLNQIFKEEKIDYKVKGKYVILRKKPKDNMRIFEGYVYDSKTGNKLTEASVYDKNLLASAVTDKYGYFSMEVPANNPISSLQISKLGYNDTLVIQLDSAIRNRNLEINMQQEDSFSRKRFFIDFQKIKPGWLVPAKLKINAQNISQPVFRIVQLSLIPYLSTNRLMGGAAVNYFSLNATVGYVQGIRAFEAGGILNFVRNNVTGFQAAGIGNVIGGNVTGFQSAGIFNIVKDVKGFQAAGIFNQTETVYGSQVAGIYNMTRDTATIQVSGIFNKSIENRIQIAGLVNFSKRSSIQTSGLLNHAHRSDFQITGFLNVTDSLEIGQIAGFTNISRKNSQLQVAGAINQTKGEAGVQIAGLLNKTRKLKHFQLGLVNIADSSSGVSIGLFTFIKNGYHKLEISADESFPVNLAFRTGTKQFHTFMMAGSTLSDNFQNLGFGIGTTFGKQKLIYDLDFSSQEIFYKRQLSGSYHWYKIYFGIDKPIAKKISLATGLTFNALLADAHIADYQNIKAHMPLYSLYSREGAIHELNFWIGGKIAFRFF